MQDAQITLQSQIFYLILTLLVLALCKLAEVRRSKFYLVSLILILSVVTGFRAYSVGRDTKIYARNFEYYYLGGVNTKDPGFGILCDGLMHIIKNPTFLFLVFAILTYALIFSRLWELRDSISFGVAAFSFYAFYYADTLNTFRQFCAVAIVFYASRFIERKKYIPYIIGVAIATLLFHRTAIVGILLLVIELFFWRTLERQQKRLLVILILMGLLFSGTIMRLFGVYQEQYGTYVSIKRTNFGIQYIVLLIILLVSLLLYNVDYYGKRICFHRTDPMLIRVRIYYIISCALLSIGYTYLFAGRIGYYFAPFMFVYFGKLATEVKPLPRLILKVMIYSVTIYLFLRWGVNSNFAGQHPYTFIWSR